MIQRREERGQATGDDDGAPETAASRDTVKCGGVCVYIYRERKGGKGCGWNGGTYICIWDEFCGMMCECAVGFEFRFGLRDGCDQRLW